MRDTYMGVDGVQAPRPTPKVIPGSKLSVDSTKKLRSNEQHISSTSLEAQHSLANLALEANLRRVHFVAWRDIDDPEAGGSELHAHRIASRWAAAGMDITFRTSAIGGEARNVVRSGYRATRQAGRYGVFPASAWQGIRMGWSPGDALVEVWNGMPFFSPVWYRGPKIVFLHHVHEEMWRMVLPPWLARIGEIIEKRIAPPFYRGTRLVALSASARDESAELLGLSSEMISVVPPGIDPQFSPKGPKSEYPLVVAVGRLVPVKRFDLLIKSLVEAKKKIPALRASIIGEGYERLALENLCIRLGAKDWIELPGRVGDDELVQWYRRAWVVASTSLREGWGMTLSEAGACGTPAVVTDIAGHRDAVLDGTTGLLVDNVNNFSDTLVSLLCDKGLLDRLGKAALERSRWFNWDATAQAALEILCVQVESKANHRK